MQDTVQASTTPPSPPEESQAPVRVLTRSRDRMLGGVAAGLADYFDIDPTIVRLGLVLTALLSGGIVIVAYIALWIIMPEPPAAQLLSAPGASPTASTAAPARGGNGALILGVILVAVGGVALMAQFPMFHVLGGLVGWGLARIRRPTMLILVGMALILARRD